MRYGSSCTVSSTGGRVAPSLTGVLALAPGNVFATGVGWASVGGGPAVVLHFNGHSWSRAAAGPAVSAGAAGGNQSEEAIGGAR